MTIAESYVDFGTREARGGSPAYERLALAVAADEEILALAATLPPGKHQPNLLFAVVRLLGGPVEEPGRDRRRRYHVWCGGPDWTCTRSTWPIRRTSRGSMP